MGKKFGKLFLDYEAGERPYVRRVNHKLSDPEPELTITEIKKFSIITDEQIKKIANKIKYKHAAHIYITIMLAIVLRYLVIILSL